MRQKMTKRRKQLFLKALRGNLSVQPACDIAGIHRSTAYRWRDEDSAFRDDWDDAQEGALDYVEAALHKRALAKSDLAAIALLRNRRRAIYNDNAKIEVEHHHSPHQTVNLTPSWHPSEAVRCFWSRYKNRIEPVIEAQLNPSDA